MPRDGLPEVDQVVSKVADDLRIHAADLPKLYQFGLPDGLLIELLQRSARFEELFGGVAGETTAFEKTLHVRQKMPAAFTSKECDDETKMFLVGWILKWGGTDRKTEDKARSIESVRRLGDDAISNPKSADQKRVPSWSKYVAFRHPQEHAILDSRVVFSLNWLLFRAGSKRFLPHDLASENTFLRLLNYWPIVLAERSSDLEVKIRAEADRLAKGGRKSHLANDLSRDIAPEVGAYAWYLELMQKIAGAVFPDEEWRLLRTEMLLFAGATTFIAQDVAKILVPLWSSAPNRRAAGLASRMGAVS